MTPGERYLVTARMTYEDVTDSFYTKANTSGPAPTFALRVHDAGFASRGVLLTNSVRKPGPVSRVFTVPAGMTGMILVAQMSLLAGMRTKFKIGELGVVRVDDKPDLEAL
ncbi:hypothetical protein CH252_05845 [Rhodococcus sp. 06-1477-1B]|nr:hypothetical protein CH252_05845 [Rhodococcus sp. 06-1477-1B]